MWLVILRNNEFNEIELLHYDQKDATGFERV
jgi:hypothetical protein